MRKAISIDEATGSSRQQAELPTVSFFDLLAIARDIEWNVDRDPTRTAVIMVSAFPNSWRQFLDTARK
jgi:hypothetical protein